MVVSVPVIVCGIVGVALGTNDLSMEITLPTALAIGTTLVGEFAGFPNNFS